MRFIVSLAILLISSSLSVAIPAPTSRDILYTDTYNDMESIISGEASCRPLALIFARGTFDSGNVGVWVGPSLITSLQSFLSSPSQLAAQGVDSFLYPATLSSYLTESGSNSGAAALASSVTEYAQACPESAIVISGWSQGALVAHKAIAKLDLSALEQIAGVVTFGDPWHLFSNESLPASIDESTAKEYCYNGVVLDPLCADLPAGFEVPDSLEGVTGAFLGLPSVAHGVQQVKAAASLVVRFPGQLAQSWSSFVSTLKGGNFVRLLLTPEHFEYGNSGATEEAAKSVSQLPLVRKALST